MPTKSTTPPPPEKVMVPSLGEEECQQHGDTIDQEVEREQPQQESESAVVSNAFIQLLQS